jgi:hypothetical protein
MVNWTNFSSQLGAELQVLRGLEAIGEWASFVNGTYFKDKLNAAYSNTDQDEDDAETDSKSDLNSSAFPSLQGAFTARASALESFFFEFIDKVFDTSDEDRTAGAVDYIYDDTLIAQGEVRIIDITGRWGAVRDQMLLDSQTIRKNVVTLGALTAGGSNEGSLVETGPAAGSDHALSGTTVFTVTDDTIGAVRLSVSLELTRPLIDGTLSIEADNEMQVGKFFEDGPTGLSTQFDLDAILETGDGDDIVSGVTITNPSEADSAKGQHFLEIERLAVGGGGPHFRVRWFNSGDLLDEDKVAEVDVTGESGTATVTLIGSSSTLVFTFHKTNAAAALPLVGDKDSDIVLDLQSPRVGDRWTKTVANDESGEFATRIAHVPGWRVSLPSVANPGQTIDDSKAAPLTIS